MGLTAFVFRKNSYPVVGLACVAMAEYVYFLFAFPVEAFHFHKRALSRDQPYAQMIRDSYIERFPDSEKARVYRRVTERQDEYYTKNLKFLKV